MTEAVSDTSVEQLQQLRRMAEPPARASLGGTGRRQTVSNDAAVNGSALPTLGRLGLAAKRARGLALGLVLTGCEPNPWQSFPISAEPDQQCRTGHEQGHDVYVWHCHHGQRIAIFQRCSALLGCNPTERQTARCGSTTAIERELKLADTCEPVPASQRWVARPPNETRD